METYSQYDKCYQPEILTGTKTAFFASKLMWSLSCDVSMVAVPLDSHPRWAGGERGVPVVSQRKGASGTSSSIGHWLRREHIS